MKCPTCKDTELTMSERQNIEIDYCPNCRGVWLDRGELDKIIEKTANFNQPVATPNYTTAPSTPPTVHVFDTHRNDHHKYKRKKSFLEELFD